MDNYRIKNWKDYQRLTSQDLDDLGTYEITNIANQSEATYGLYNCIIDSLIGNLSVVQDIPVPSFQVIVTPGIVYSASGVIIVVPNNTTIVISAPDPSLDRIDIVQMSYVWVDTDAETRNIIDPTSKTISASSIYTSKVAVAKIEVKPGIASNSPVAPTTNVGYIKLSEIYIKNTDAQILNGSIYNVTSYFYGTNNTSWTTEPHVTHRSMSLQDHRSLSIADHPVGSIVAQHINDDIAGEGLLKNPSTAKIDVVVDNSTLEIVGDTVRIKNLGVNKDKINDNVVGLGLVKDTDGSLKVNAIGDISTEGDVVKFLFGQNARGLTYEFPTMYLTFSSPNFTLNFPSTPYIYIGTGTNLFKVSALATYSFNYLNKYVVYIQPSASDYGNYNPTVALQISVQTAYVYNPRNIILGFMDGPAGMFYTVLGTTLQTDKALGKGGTSWLSDSTDNYVAQSRVRDFAWKLRKGRIYAQASADGLSATFYFDDCKFGSARPNNREIIINNIGIGGTFWDPDPISHAVSVFGANAVIIFKMTATDWLSGSALTISTGLSVVNEDSNEATLDYGCNTIIVGRVRMGLIHIPGAGETWIEYDDTTLDTYNIDHAHAVLPCVYGVNSIYIDDNELGYNRYNNTFNGVRFMPATGTIHITSIDPDVPTPVPVHPRYNVINAYLGITCGDSNSIIVHYKDIFGVVKTLCVFKGVISQLTALNVNIPIQRRNSIGLYLAGSGANAASVYFDYICYLL